MKLLFPIMLLLLVQTLSGQDLSLYQKREFTGKDGKIMPYRILYPENYDQ